MKIDLSTLKGVDGSYDIIQGHIKVPLDAPKFVLYHELGHSIVHKSHKVWSILVSISILFLKVPQLRFFFRLPQLIVLLNEMWASKVARISMSYLGLWNDDAQNLAVTALITYVKKYPEHEYLYRKWVKENTKFRLKNINWRNHNEK